jgi:hypothetical protein
MRALLLCLLPVAALAQERDIQRELIQRQQRSDAFTLQLRHSQEALKAPPEQRTAVEARQLAERQRLENVSERQLSEVRADAPRELRAYERKKAQDERRAIVEPR